ncbi:MAG: hypothetical protein ACI8QZ_001995 [Chlamydiales bacterium]|jgi:uncharacterized protein involved in exopolysaccharide biosynthesis
MTDQVEVEAFEDEAAPALDLKVLVLFGVGRSRFLVAFCLFVGTALGLVFAAAKPNIYSSVARLHFLAGQREGLDPEFLAGLKATSLPSIGVGDEIILLEAPEIYERVAQRIGVGRVLAEPNPEALDTADTALHIKTLHAIQAYLGKNAGGEGCADEKSEKCIRLAGIKLKEHTTLTAVGGSFVIDVQHKASSPERAQEFAQALVEGFVDRHREVYSAETHAGKARQEMLKVDDKVNEDRETYREHRQLCGFQSLGEERSELRKEVTLMNKALSTDVGRRSQVGGELEEYQKYLAEIPPLRDRVTEPQLGPNPEHSLVLSERMRMQLQLSLAKGEAVFDERQRTIARIERQIVALTEQLDQLEPLIELRGAIIEKVPNPEYFEYKRKVDALTAEDNGLGLAIQEKQKNLRQLREQLDLAGECEKTHDIWSKRIVDGEQDLEQRKTVYYKVRGLNDLDAEDESNLRIYQGALLPAGKSGPQRIKTVMMGLFGGLAAGAGIAVLRQLMERRVRYARTLENQLGLTVLAVVPETAIIRKLARRRAAAHA